MQNYLQAILTRSLVSCVFFLGALSGSFAQELYEEADIAFNRRGYYEASSDYIAAYAKVKTGDNTYGYTGQDERSTGGVNMSRAGILSGTSKPKVNYNVGGRNMRHTGGR